jgi:hypothetical protein
MELAVLFDEAREHHRFYASATALNAVLGSGVLQGSGGMLLIRSGSVLVRRASENRLPSLVEEVFFGDSWRRADAGRLRTAATSSTVFAWLISNIDMKSAVALDAALGPEKAYLGSMAVNRLVRAQRALFRQSLPLLLRVHGTSCNAFYSELSPDGRDNAMFGEIEKLGFETVNWEDSGLRDSIFDDFDTDDHFERLEALRHFLTSSLGSNADGADEILLLLEDLNPRLAATLGTAARALMSAVSEEDRAHVGLSARRYLEQLADAIYPARDDMVDGRDVSAPKVKNRVWAFINGSIRPTSTVEQQRVRCIGKQFDRILDDANKVLHAAPSHDEAKELLTRLAMVTVTLLHLSETAARRPYLAYSAKMSSTLEEWLKPDEHIHRGD